MSGGHSSNVRGCKTLECSPRRVTLRGKFWEANHGETLQEFLVEPTGKAHGEKDVITVCKFLKRYNE